MEAKKSPKAIVGIDIGGTLAKVCVCLQDDQAPGGLPLNIRELNVTCSDGTICSFHKFQSSNIEEMIQFLTVQKLLKRGDVVHVSGGGAHKYGNLIEKELGVELKPVDEMTSIAKGIEFLVRNAPDSRFSYSKITGRFTLGSTEEYPYLLVNIGSGVSILKFNSSKEYERIGGTALGGGTFLGLCNMILKENNFETLMDLTTESDNMKVDLGFDDVYKTSDSPKNAHNTGFGFEKEIIGVSLGKMDSYKKTDELDKGAIAKSLLYMTAYNIAQIAYLSAKMENIHTIYFAGNFIRGNTTTINTISSGLELFSNMYQFPVTAIFLKHDGFLGALGCIEITSSSITVPV